MNSSLNITQKVSNKCELILYALVLILVFEGVVRKLLPFLSIPVFFLKDILCVITLLFINTLRLTGIVEKLRSSWKNVFSLFTPLFLFTAFKDPVLTIFAAKQYLLYVIVAIAITVAFPIYREGYFRKLLFFTSLLLIPTTIIAVLQNSLPSSHWLNLSVGGESLEAFSAAGYLRVSSTFSFTGQYSWFLNAESCFLLVSFFMPPDIRLLAGKLANTAVYSLLALMLVVGAFITGGRTAVLGCGATLVLGFFFIGIKRPKWFFSKGIIIVIGCIAVFSILREAKPEFFAAYDQRSSGSDRMTHNEEVTTRVIGGFTDWTSWYQEQDVAAMFLGNGLGVMSNGSAQISTYAAAVRATSWTEGDVPTTFWEGGLYLALIWYGFRLSVILLSVRLWYSMKNRVLASAAAFPLASVVINGFFSQLAMQPPLSIWWWMAIGIIICIYRLDRHMQTNNVIANIKNHERHHIY